MKSDFRVLKNLLRKIKINFALNYNINLQILMVVSILIGSINLISLSNADQHETNENQLNITAFERQMLLEANEVTIDYANNNITATGNVRIHYDLYTLKAGKVHLNREKSIFTAVENVELIEPSGNIIMAESIELSEDFKNGFIRLLQIESIQRTVLHSPKAERKDGITTSLEDGLYSVYLNRPDDSAPPWRIRAGEIILNHETDRVSFKNSTIEIFGVPIVVLPDFSMTDPLVPRITGLLGPTLISDTRLGYGIAIPYFYAPYPNLDITVSAAPLSSQGIIMSGELRSQGRFCKKNISHQQLIRSSYMEIEKTKYWNSYC